MFHSKDQLYSAGVRKSLLLTANLHMSMDTGVDSHAGSRIQDTGCQGKGGEAGWRPPQGYRDGVAIMDTRTGV